MIGTVVSHYEILEQIGSGGMGVVYRARDIVLERDVALKFLPLELSHDEQANARFMQEAKSASALEHPNICTIFEVGRANDGRLFIAMPLYDGKTLKDLIGERRSEDESEAGDKQPVMEIGEAMKIVRQVAEGLAAAYEKGIVHRDIKPANIMVTGAGRVIILDFGLAKLPGALNLTRTGSTLGTAAYMSPEQISGGEVDVRTDLWSLGVVWYELLSGRRPFDADYEQALTYAVVNTEPAPIPGIPSEIADVVDCLLSKRPEARFPTPRALIDSLPVSKSTMVSGRPIVTGRGRAMSILAAAAAIVILVLAIAFLANRRSPDQVSGPDPTAITVAPFSVSGNPGLEYLGEGIVDLLSLRLDGAAGFRASDPNAVIGTIQKEDLTIETPSDAVDLARRLDAAYSVVGRIIDIGGSIQIIAAVYDQEGERLKEVRSVADNEFAVMSAADDLATQILSAVANLESDVIAFAGVETTDSFDALKAYLEGESLIRRGAFRDATQRLRAAVDADSNFALAWLRLAYAAGWGISSDDETEGLHKAYAKREALPPRLRKFAEASYHESIEGRIELARNELLELLSQHPDDLLSLHELGELLFHSNPYYGRPATESRQYFERALRLAPNHGDNLIHLLDLAEDEGNRPLADSLELALLSLDSVSSTAMAVKAYRSLQTRPKGVGAEAAGDLSLLGGPVQAWNLFLQVATVMEDVAIARDFAVRAQNELDLPDRSTHWFDYAAELMDVAEGRYGRFKKAIALQTDAYASTRLVSSAVLRSLPGYPATELDLRQIQSQLASWDTTSQPAMYYIFEVFSGSYGPSKEFLESIIALRLGDEIALERHRTALADIAESGSQSNFAQALMRTIDALEAYGAGDLDSALNALDRAKIELPWRVRARLDVHSQILNIYLRAELLAETGKTQEAIEIFEAMRSVDFRGGIPLYGLIYLRAGQLYEKEGRIDEAMDRYARVARLWAEADPEFVPLRRTAEEALDRLALNAIREPS